MREQLRLLPNRTRMSGSTICCAAKPMTSGKLLIKPVTAGAHKIRVRADSFKEISQPLTAAQKGDVKIALVKTTDEAELAFQEAERLSTADREKAVAAYRKAIKSASEICRSATRARPNFAGDGQL